MVYFQMFDIGYQEIIIQIHTGVPRNFNCFYYSVRQILLGTNMETCKIG